MGKGEETMQVKDQHFLQQHQLLATGFVTQIFPLSVDLHRFLSTRFFAIIVTGRQ